MISLNSAVIDYAKYVPSGGHTVVGDLKVLPGIPSPQLGNRRDILVHLPAGYDTGSQCYPVIYMHDGQNLFDQFTSYAGEWQVDETMQLLEAEGRAAIVVGISNAGVERINEYSPFQDRQGRGGQGEAYLAFLVATLKPLIDQTFRTLPDRAHTAILGSSLGGLISLYAFFRYPATFGLAGVMSPSLDFADGALTRYVRAAPYVPGRLYLDAGTLELASSLADRMMRAPRYSRAARRLYQLLQQKGYQSEHDLQYVEDQGGLHNEAAWARRLPAALRFLLADSRWSQI